MNEAFPVPYILHYLIRLMAADLPKMVQYPQIGKKVFSLFSLSLVSEHYSCNAATGKSQFDEEGRS